MHRTLLTSLLAALLAATSQPLDGLSPGVERLCGVSVAPDMPHGEPWSTASASNDELPDLPPWCDGTCVVDIAFIYADDVMIGDSPGPRSRRELRRNLEEAVNLNNVAWRDSGLDAELRIVGLERDPGLNGMSPFEAIDRASERLLEIRHNHGADLVYALTGYDRRACGIALVRRRGMSAESAALSAAVGVLGRDCVGNNVLVHEVGHNLGLAHDSEPGFYVPFGRGYGRGWPDGRGAGTSYRTVMHRAASGGIPAVFSSPDRLHGRVIGDADTDAARGLRYTIPDATRYSPTVVPTAQDDLEDYGCLNRSNRVCLNNWRFAVGSSVATAAAAALVPAYPVATYGLGDSAALFYFFDSANPELLVKVVNGCWLNDHWWVFGSAATDLEYSIRVDDFASGLDANGRPTTTNTYRHVGGGVIVGDNGYSTGAGVINDTKAFPCAP